MMVQHRPATVTQPIYRRRRDNLACARPKQCYHFIGKWPRNGCGAPEPPPPIARLAALQMALVMAMELYLTAGSDLYSLFNSFVRFRFGHVSTPNSTKQQCIQAFIPVNASQAARCRRHNAPITTPNLGLDTIHQARLVIQWQKFHFPD